MKFSQGLTVLTLTGAWGCERTPIAPPVPSTDAALVERLNECRTVWECRLSPCDPSAPENAPQAFELAPASGSTEPQIGHTAQLCEGFRAPIVCVADRDPNTSYFVWGSGLQSPYAPHLTVDTHDLAKSGPSVPWTLALCSDVDSALNTLREREKNPHTPI